ncbi:MAG: DUF721 domain-containing protein [Bdellovibrionales bacterium]|nr:DUF721 domain-containing protein [Bdellovibrionales bacterium]
MRKKRFSCRKPLEIKQIFQVKGVSPKIRNLVPLYRIQKRWEALVGSQVSNRAWPIRIEKDRIVVKVENAAWSMQLGFLKENILEMIKTDLGLVFSDIQFVLGPTKKIVFEAEQANLPMNLSTDDTHQKNEPLADLLTRIRKKMIHLSTDSADKSPPKAVDFWNFEKP